MTEPRTETVHACPERDSGFTPCCNRPPFELRGDRLTLDPALVTCKPTEPRTHPYGVVIPPNEGDALDRHFPRRGPCMICGVPGEDARHRVIDAIAERIAAGDSEEDTADDYGVTVEAVRAAIAATAPQEPQAPASGPDSGPCGSVDAETAGGARLEPVRRVARDPHRRDQEHPVTLPPAARSLANGLAWAAFGLAIAAVALVLLWGLG